MAAGSLAELATQIEIARRQGYIDAATGTRIEAQLTRTAQLLHGVLRSLRLQALTAGAAVTMAGLAVGLAL